MRDTRSSRLYNCKNRLNSSFVKKLRNMYGKDVCKKNKTCINSFNRGFKNGFIKSCMKRKSIRKI